MTTATAREPEALLGARVAAWLRVGGSWAAIAAAHGATDIDAFKRSVTPHLTAPSATTRPPERRGQLRLF
jgi:hypothetical protein